MLDLIVLLLPIAGLLLWWMIGSMTEHGHLASLERRERELAGIEVSSLPHPSSPAPGSEPKLVTAEVVLASDGFKTWVFGLRNLFGGESKSFSRLYQRARREAVVRLKTAARDAGCNAVCNLRVESADIGGNANGGKAMPMAVCALSGTAYRREAPTP
ncbi:MAG: heavy metal-binding domain-containing protein [Kiritimatiellae bacterium]|nr:heavy metal-binding domain-containing protein [Kiritimatiellia bacterium]